MKIKKKKKGDNTNVHGTDVTCFWLFHVDLPCRPLRCKEEIVEGEQGFSYLDSVKLFYCFILWSEYLLK